MIQVVVNEMPVVLPGCEHDFCPYETFYEQYKDILDTCNFKNICRLQNHDELQKLRELDNNINNCNRTFNSYTLTVCEYSSAIGHFL